MAVFPDLRAHCPPVQHLVVLLGVSVVRATPDKKPIVIISSYPPRPCGIATFTEEAREFVQKHHPERDVLVVSHVDGEGQGVFPVIDVNRPDWWRAAAEKVRELDPYVVHLEHEYGLYEHRANGMGDANQGFLNLLDAIRDYPTIFEPHTIHGRYRETEFRFIAAAAERVDVFTLKCHYQKWRMDWNFTSAHRQTPRNVMVIPHGARPDKRWAPEDVPALKAEIGLDKLPYVGNRICGLVGWIQSNKRWDILTSMWEEIVAEVREKTGEEWDLLAAGQMRDPNDLLNYRRYRGQIELLESKGLAHFYEFIPRGDIYYRVMAICDFIVLPSLDETQSGTLARIIALNKPYVTTAPLEGLTAQTLESDGGLLFTNKKMLREAVIKLMCDESERQRLGDNLKKYLEEVVSWDIVAELYGEAYELARQAKRAGHSVELPMEF